MRFYKVLILIIIVLIMIKHIVLAKVSGPCSNCHTMHYSQSGAIKPSWGKEGPYQNLLINDCVGCHSAGDSSTWKNSIGAPIVYNPGEPSYGGLAGGNFYYVTQNDTYGHNVVAIPGVDQDEYITKTPGHVDGKTCSGCHGSGNMVLTKCVFCHNPKHHGDENGPVVGDDEEVKYRFLSLDYFHPHTFQEGAYNFYGVAGIEDDDWERTVSSTDHNEYCGAASSGDYEGKSHSINRYCAACHWGFYGNNTEHWVRHPSDYALPDSGEYANYTTYNPLVPIARPENILTSMTNSSSSVTPGVDQVSCLSCHRPHASPYPSILRWDYNACLNGQANSCGCFVCHTEKD
ncbi:MAG: hypothetical protein DRO04_02750 [Candidatus Iainarchaeum archaeon]|uniref:Doubled CXXCH motif domain-containing protein n=1 Tax=Candidatus Iainarchaeum sp. TaxID=3101447 RepID=A0A497JHH9_9ARCH|nr:MAG: hypothetical protein DRO04_02750 [Candidatus Diapherotrites archaeon]